MTADNRLFEELPAEDQLQLEQLIRRFDTAWQRREQPTIGDYLPSDGIQRYAALIELVHTDLEYRLKAGEPARVEAYMGRYPELQRDERVVTSLIAAEYELRERCRGPTLEEYLQRFPQYRAQLSSRLEATTPERDRLSPSSSLFSHPTPRVGDDGTKPSSPASSRLHDESSGPNSLSPLPSGEGSLLGRFQLLKSAGAGSFGTVYKAVDPRLDRVVALKIPRMGSLTTKEQAGRFLREARNAAHLKHPSIVPVHEVGQVDGMVYLVSDFVDGVSLADQLRVGAIDFFRAAELIAQVADALHYAHEQGVVHRDIKPGNILLDAEGQPHVMDFGLSRRETGDSTLTVEGQLLGTPAYISPEQARGEARKVDRRSDVYSLGAILYELIAGQLPFTGSSRMVMVQVLQDEPRAPGRLNDTIPRDLETICLKAMAKEPGKRYQTGGELAADLRRFVAGEPVRARPVGPSVKLWRWCRRKPLVASLTATLLLALVGGFAGISWQWQRARSLGEQSQDRLVRQYVDSGVRAIEQGDYLGSLPWFLEALKWEERDSLGEAAQLFRVNAIFQRSPRLTQFWYHRESVTHAEFSFDGRYVATASKDGTGRIWDAVSGKPTGPPFHHDDQVYCIRLDPSAQWAVTGSVDRTARTWDVRTGEPLSPRLWHSGSVISADISSNGALLVTSDNSGRARVWKAPTGEAMTPWLEHKPKIERVIFSPDDNSLATASDDGTVCLWDVHTGRRLMSFGNHDEAHDVQFSPKGTRLVTCGRDGTARIWDVSTGEALGPEMRHHSIVNRARFSPDGRLVVTASMDQTAQIWSVETGRAVGPPMSHASDVYHAAFSPDSRLVVTASWDNSARVWETGSGRPVTPPLMHAHFVLEARFSPDGSSVLTSSVDGAARLWALPDAGVVDTVLRHGSAVKLASLLPDGKHVITHEVDGTIRSWDWQTGQHAILLAHVVAPGAAFAISPDGTKIAVAAGDNQLSVSETATGKQLSSTQIDTASVRQLAFSDSGQRLMTVTEDATIRIWNATTGKPLGRPIRSELPVNYAEFSPDETRVVGATGGARTVGAGKVWNVNDGRAVTGPLPHERLVVHASFSPDGRRVVTTCRDPSFASREATMWDVTTGAPVGLPMRHRGGVSFAAFSPHGRYVVTCSDDHTARIWDANNAQPLTPPMRHNGIDSLVLMAAFSPNGRYVATASHDGEVRLWEAKTGQLLAQPLVHEQRVNSISFSRDGTLLLSASDDRTAKIWRLPQNDQSLADIAHQATLMAAHRIDGTGALVPIKVTELHDIWRKRRSLLSK